MAALKHIICLSAMTVIFMASAAPTLNSNNPNIPWAHPCMPNGQLTKVDTNTFLPDFKIACLIDKTENTQSLVDDLLDSLEGKIADPKVTNSLHMAPVAGFPKVNQSVKQKGVSIYSDHFSQLSKAAVFLEKIQYDRKDEDLQPGLEDLFTENLRQMCELHVALVKQKTQLPVPASRSIMPAALLQSSFAYYKRNYEIIYQYKLLLKNHLAEYRQISKKSATTHLV